MSEKIAAVTLVTERDLLDRVNEKLAPQEKILRSRQVEGYTDLGAFTPYSPDFGKFYRVTMRHGTLVEGNVGLEALARKLGVLADGEALEVER
jgi:hypothetical protein